MFMNVKLPNFSKCNKMKEKKKCYRQYMSAIKQPDLSTAAGQPTKQTPVDA